MWNLKYGTNEPIYRTKIDSEKRLGVAKGERGRRDGLGAWGCQMQTTTFRMDKQQGPNVQQRNYFQYPMIDHNGKYKKERMQIEIPMPSH